MQRRNDSAIAVSAETEGDAVTAPFLFFQESGGVRKARRLEFSARETAGGVLRFALEDGAAMIAANARAALDSDAPEAPHQLRVGLRRTRAVLWAARKLFEPKTMWALGDRARVLGQIAGDVRMMDVLRLEMLPQFEPEVTAALGNPKAMQSLIKRTGRQAAKRRKALRAAEIMLDAARLSCDLLALAHYATSDEAPKCARRGARRWAKAALCKAADRVFAHPAAFEDMSIERRHQLRKDSKRLRYTLEGFQPLFDPDVYAPAHRAARRLCNALGSLNDEAEVAKLRELAPESCYQPAVEATIAAAEALSRADEPKAAERWRALQKVARFWR